MSNKKDKERWLKIQANKKKCCANCSQLHKGKDGNYLCGFLKSPKDHAGGFLLVPSTNIHHVRGVCFDKYNGKNVKPNGEVVY